ncbi:MAG: tetratricopeptide repeat protein [Verrucomicrobia bacterium]|nr:tetratricopeptide repeat protein [Verrucomicrobiota bacterium]
MKKLVVFAVFLTAFIIQCGPLFAAGPAKDASDLFLRAYLQIQEGDGAFDKGDYTAAQTRYKDALAILKDIQSVQPDWNPHIISFREHYCDQRIAEAKVRLAGGGAPVKTPTAVATPATPATPAARPRAAAASARTPSPSVVAGTSVGAPGSSQPSSDLSQELERLREQVRRMQAERAAAPAPVITPVAAPAPTPAPVPKPPAAENEHVKKLESELNDMRKQLQQFIGEKNQTPPPMPLPSGDAQRVSEMTDQIATLRSQLQQLLAERAQWEQSRQEFARLQTERSSLLSQLQDRDQRLAAGPSVLDASQSKALSEQLAQSARTIEALRSESKQLSVELSTTRNDARDKAAKVAQLVPLTEQLNATKAEIAKIREELAAKDQQIVAKQQALVSKSQEAARAELQIKGLAALQQSNTNLRLSLGRVESLIALGKNREQESSTQIDRLKQQLQEVKTQLTEAQRKETEAAKLRDELAAKSREAGHAQDQVKDLSKLQKTNADLRLSMSKADALAAVALDRERESAAQLDQLKQQIKEAETQLAEARRTPSKPSAPPVADRATVAQVEELKRKLEEVERRTAADRAKADRAAVAQVEELKQKMEEAERRAAAAAKDRALLAKEKDVLRLAVEKKTSEHQKLAESTEADRKKLASLEKKYRELNHQVAVLEMTGRKLSPEEEAFLKRTEVLVQPSAGSSVSGEISANVRRAKERALAQVAALDSPAGIPARPAPKFAQVAPAPETTRVVSDATNAAVRTSPSQTPPLPAAPFAAPPAAPSATPQISADLKPLVDEARELFGRQKYEEAAAKYREILKRDPENLFGLSNLAVIRFQQDRLEEAEHLLNRAIQIAPDDAYSRATIGIIYFKQGRIDDAIEELTRALKLNPNNVEAHNYLGIACWKKGWRSAAEQELRRAIEMRPDYADAHYNLAVIYATQKPPFLGLAKFHYRKTLELGRPRDPNLEKTLTGETSEK